MSRRAWAYIITVIVVAGALSVLTLFAPFPSRSDWVTLIVLAAFATICQLFKSLFSSKSELDHASTSYSPAYIFFSAGVLLLPPALFVLLAIIPHLVEWIKERSEKSNNLSAWYIQPFNIATHLLCGLVAQRVYPLLNPLALAELPPQLVSGLVVVVLYVALNHLLVGGALVLGRGVTWKESGVLELENLSPDLIMMSLGYVVALLWAISPWLVLPALSPLVLIQRALMVPQLKKEARLDRKTGLWNASYFAELFKVEFERARRFDRPLALIMSDLDLLRNINNTYGHLAGDAVLERIGEIIRETVREYDIAARFGGEEFVIALPETQLSGAVALAERLRQAVESTEFHAKTTPSRIRATISIGIACFPIDATTANDLIHAADIGVYQAKLQGRNCVVSSSDLPRSLHLETVSAQGRLEAPSLHPFRPRPEPENKPSERKKDASPFRSDAVKGLSPGATSTTPVAADSREKPERDNQPPDTVRAGTAPHPPDVQPHRDTRRQVLFYSFVALVISLGAFISIWAFILGAPQNLVAIGFLTALAVIGELLQIDAAEENTISTSVAVNFAAALIAGPVGLVSTSGAIALTHRLRQPTQGGMALYKTAFNWSAHILAGMAPILALSLANLPLEASHLPVLLFAAALASLLYFGVDTGLLATAIALSSGAKILSVWKGNFSWLTSHYVVLCVMGLIMAVAYHTLDLVGLIAFTAPALMMRYAQSQYVERTRVSMQELKRLNQQLAQANEEIVHASGSIHQLNDELFLTLAKIIDARDPYVSGHSDKVSEYATAIAIELGLAPERVERVRQAALLHDIGKIGIPERVLHKPDRLTADEYELVKTHVIMGGDFIDTCQGLRHLAIFVRHHHEWWNGTGYPDRLHGEQIPLEARILAVCDAVEAMASDRPYHRALTLDEIGTEIRRYAGTQFDPLVAETFIHVAETEGIPLVTNSAREVEREEGHKGDPAREPAERLSPRDLEFIVLPNL